jgi:predicted membrane chloride channel (bestrophin family)
MRNLRQFARLIDRQTLTVMLVAVGSTYACLRFGITVDLPFALVAVAIVFPIVLTISGAFQRRESALTELAELRANLLAIYLAQRDWQQREPVSDAAARIRIQRLHRCIRECLRQRGRPATTAVYEQLSDLSRAIEAMRDGHGLSPSELARLNQYFRNAIANFERLRNIAGYRTPVSLRAYTQVFLNVFPVLFAPYFALVSTQGWPPLGFVMASLYSLVLVGLDNIQEGLEDPFDGVGVDDVQLDGSVEQLWLDDEVLVEMPALAP